MDMCINSCVYNILCFRPRKNVDYSKFASVNTDCDDEDDFVDGKKIVG